MTEDKAIVTTNEGSNSLVRLSETDKALATLGIQPDMTGTEELTVFPKMPFYTVGQKGDRTGKIVSDLTGDKYDKLPIILVKMVPSRVCWGETAEEVKYDPTSDAPPICRSYNGRTPTDKIYNNDKCARTFPVSDVCCTVERSGGVVKRVPVCHLAQSSTDEAGNWIPPLCQDNISTYFIDIEHEVAAILELSGVAMRRKSGTKEVMTLNQFVQSIQGRQAKHLFLYEVTIETMIAQTTKGEPYMPVIRADSVQSLTVDSPTIEHFAPMIGNIQKFDPDATYDDDDDAPTVSE